VRGALGGAGDDAHHAGYAGGLRLVLDVLAGRGARRIGLEDPGYMFNPAAVRRAGLEVVAVPSDADGIDTSALRRLDPDSVVVTPSHTHPLGGVLSPERRAELLAWARERDRVIVEDDYDAEFRYDRDPVGALQGLAPDRVILAGTASKLLAPGLRLGWLVAPSDLVAPLREAALVQEHGGPALDQVALAVLFETGAVERHVRAGRARYRARRAALLAALAERLPECPVGGIEAGLTVWIGLRRASTRPPWRPRPSAAACAPIRSRPRASSATSREGSCSATRTPQSASCARPSRCWRPRFRCHAPDPDDPADSGAPPRLVLRRQRAADQHLMAAVRARARGARSNEAGIAELGIEVDLDHRGPVGEAAPAARALDGDLAGRHVRSVAPPQGTIRLGSRSGVESLS
jgi:hypothetical protein